MNYLLDTCCFLWMCSAREKLSDSALSIIENPNNTLYLNQVSFWEIQLKYLSGKLKLKYPPEQLVKKAIELFELRYQKINDDAIVHLSKLPDYHKDPFDRLLISHAIVNHFAFITPDMHIQKYPVKIIW